MTQSLLNTLYKKIQSSFHCSVYLCFYQKPVQFNFLIFLGFIALAKLIWPENDSTFSYKNVCVPSWPFCHFFVEPKLSMNYFFTKTYVIEIVIYHVLDVSSNNASKLDKISDLITSLIFQLSGHYPNYYSKFLTETSSMKRDVTGAGGGIWGYLFTAEEIPGNCSSLTSSTSNKLIKISIKSFL